MNNLNYAKEFEKIEKRIASNIENGRDVKNLLRTKARLLFVCYHKIVESIEKGELKPIAPNFAKELAFLNNIKQIQIDIDDDTNEVDKEIEKVHSLMEKNGFSWLIKNLPEEKK